VQLSFTQKLFPTVQNIVWMLLHVSATNSGHLQAATVLEDTCSVLCNLSTVNGEIYMWYHSTINYLL